MELFYSNIIEKSLPFSSVFPTSWMRIACMHSQAFGEGTVPIAEVCLLNRLSCFLNVLSPVP